MIEFFIGVCVGTTISTLYIACLIAFKEMGTLKGFTGWLLYKLGIKNSYLPKNGMPPVIRIDPKNVPKPWGHGEE